VGVLLLGFESNEGLSGFSLRGLTSEVCDCEFEEYVADIFEGANAEDEGREESSRDKSLAAASVGLWPFALRPVGALYAAELEAGC
jgi:hypothetical protein